MKSIKCPQCKLTHWDSDEVCKRCGSALHEISPLANEQAFTSAPYQYQPVQTTFQQNLPGQQKMGLAIASMVLGFLGCFPPLGLIFGIVALRRSNRSPQEYGGYGFAVAGIVLNSIGLLIIPFFALLVASIAVPNLVAARNAANEAAAISSLRTLQAAEITYAATTGQGSCGQIAALSDAGLIDSALASGKKHGYRFDIVFVKNRGCDAYATPLTGNSGRSFYLSNEGLLRGADKRGQKADSADP
jgi:type II secretory pathway pseudopilin PulG